MGVNSENNDHKDKEEDVFDDDMPFPFGEGIPVEY